MIPIVLLVIYCVCISAASLVGGLIPLLLRMTHARLEVIISLVAGFMLGVGMLHMLPHGLMTIATHTAMCWLLAGFLFMFFIERFLCFHHHDIGQPPQAQPAHAGQAAGHHSHPLDATRQGHELTWGGAAIGLTLHSVIGGVALAASVHADRDNAASAAGLAVFLVILLHKPFDSLTLGTLMAVGRWSTSWRHLVNVLFAGATPLGAALFAICLDTGSVLPEMMVGYALVFSAGTFLCIATSDLLPELQFHQHDRIKLSAALVAGLVLSWAVTQMEGTGHDTHDHGHENVQVHESH